MHYIQKIKLSRECWRGFFQVRQKSLSFVRRKRLPRLRLNSLSKNEFAKREFSFVAHLCFIQTEVASLRINYLPFIYITLTFSLFYYYKTSVVLYLSHTSSSTTYNKLLYFKQLKSIIYNHNFSQPITLQHVI